MDGDLAPLEDLYKLRDKHNAFLIVDEAHAVGVFGDQGQGLAAKADVVIGTFGKAFGSFGSYVTCSQSIRDFLIQHCAGLIYSTGPSPFYSWVNSSSPLNDPDHAKRASSYPISF